MTDLTQADRALFEVLGRAGGYLDVIHRSLGLHDHMGVALRCEGCEVLSDIERLRASMTDRPNPDQQQGEPT